MKGTFVFLADGFEEVEAILTIDILRRGGVDVKTVSIYEDNLVEGAHGIQLISDMNWDEFAYSVTSKMMDMTAAEDFMIFPGGMPGSTNLAAHEDLMKLAAAHYEVGGSLAAICAAPAYVLASLQEGGEPLLKGTTMTCYDGCEGPFAAAGITRKAESSVVCGRVITGRGPGYAREFALDILSAIKGKDTAAEVAAGFTPGQ